jgi:hypothetical protein
LLLATLLWLSLSQVGKTAGSVLLAPDPEKLEAFYSNL